MQVSKAILVLFTAFAGTAFAEEVGQGDRDRAMSYLHGTRKQTLDAVAGLSDAQMKFKPADDKWSIAEVIEHLALTEGALFGALKKTVASPVPASPPEKKATDDAILRMIPNREQKAKAPDTLVPTGRFGSPAANVAKFKEARDGTLDYIRTTKEDLRRHWSPSPMGETDGVQWLLFIAAHNERHLGQIAEITSDSKFPR
jgi:hypothetical protein